MFLHVQLYVQRVLWQWWGKGICLNWLIWWWRITPCGFLLRHPTLLLNLINPPVEVKEVVTTSLRATRLPLEEIAVGVDYHSGPETWWSLRHPNSSSLNSHLITRLGLIAAASHCHKGLSRFTVFVLRSDRQDPNSCRQDFVFLHNGAPFYLATFTRHEHIPDVNSPQL